MTDHNATLERLKTRFDPQAAQDMDDIFQFDVTDAEDYYLHVQDGTLGVHNGEHDEPSVTLAADSTTLKGIMSGEIDGMHAFMSGKLKATGNLMLATKLSKLFPRE